MRPRPLPRAGLLLERRPLRSSSSRRVARPPLPDVPARRCVLAQDFTPCELFARIRGRTLWFMGDSQTWALFLAAECFLREFSPGLRRE